LTVGGGPDLQHQDPLEPVFAVFLETLRDRREGQLPEFPACLRPYAPMLETVVAHEVMAHALGGDVPPAVEIGGQRQR
jgi:hypothetical protein